MPRRAPSLMPAWAATVVGGIALALLLGGLWLSSVPAIAATLPVPAGWRQGEEVSASAHARAQAWAKAWGGEVQRIASTDDDDELSETLVMIDVAQPLPLDVVDSPERARPWLEQRVRAALGTDATVVTGTVSVDGQGTEHVAIVHAEAELGDQLFFIAVGPRGAHHLTVALLINADEQILYRSVFERARGALTGLQPPLLPFPATTLQIAAWIFWIALTIAIVLAWIRHPRNDGQRRSASRSAAAVIVVLTALAFVALGLQLDSASVELALAETTPWSLATACSLGGIITALVVVLTGETMARRHRPVLSAPTDGSFSGVGPVAPADSPPAPLNPTTQAPAASPNANVDPDAPVRLRIEGIVEEIEPPASLVDAHDELTKN